MSDAVTTTITKLSAAERDTLSGHEAVIQRGLATFFEVGEALAAIRDSRLYRAEHGTFEAYCRERWGMARSRAYQFIEAAAVVALVHNCGHPAPSNESQARPLTVLAPEQQAAAWAAAVETAPEGKVTAAHVERVVEAVQRGESPAMAVHFSSLSPEWYTPPEVVQRVVGLFGRIDLDPCSNSRTEPAVPAERLYVREDDGLSREWHGRVYMNPPYGRELVRWVEKLLAERAAGRVSEAVVLVPARTDTAWCGLLREHPHCFVRGRLTFSAAEHAAPFPSLLVYLGERTREFGRAFRGLGDTFVLADLGETAPESSEAEGEAA
jgi:hypothetical protein